MNTLKRPSVPAEPQTESLPAPEPELLLQSLATPAGDAVLVMHQEQRLLYGEVRRSRALTAQSDFLRLQTRLLFSIEGGDWVPAQGDEAKFQNQNNQLWIRADHPSRTLQIGPRGGLTLSEGMRNSHLDSYLLAQLAHWGKTSYPDYRVAPNQVTITGNVNDAEKRRRQGLYAAQGFEFEWQDDAKKAALFFKDKASKLVGMWDEDKLSELRTEQLLASLAEQDRLRIAQEIRLASLESKQLGLQHALQKERNTNMILLGVTIFVLLMLLWLAW